jgi:hypothetical protein
LCDSLLVSVPVLDPAAFKFNLAEHCSVRASEVATQLRLRRQFAMPDVLCALCGQTSTINVVTGVLDHKCPNALPPVKEKKEDSGCALQ